MIGRLPVAAGWLACFVLAAGFHAAGAAALMARWSEPAEPIAGGAVVLVELAPIAATPTPIQHELPPAPQQVDSAGEQNLVEDVKEEKKVEPIPEPVEKVEEKKPEPVHTAAIVQQPDPEPAIDPDLLVTPKPRPPEPEKKPKKEVKKKQKQASLASAPSPSERRAKRQTAPAVAAARNPAALSSWRARLAAQLERNKRYPPAARTRGDHGTAQLAFTIDRNGSVRRARIARSSGSDALDRETLALIARAQPLPPPPPELGGSITISVPIRYSMH